MNRIERYLASVMVLHTFLVWLVLLALIGFSEFMNQLDDLTESYRFSTAALYVVLKLPNYAYQLFPVALLIGTLMGLGGLANHSELTVLRVTGWSIRRIFIAVAKAALLFWLLVTLVGETIGVNAQTYASKVRAEAQNKQFSIGGHNQFWVKNQQRFIEVGQALSNKDLRQVVIYQVENGELTAFRTYERVLYQQGKWLAESSMQRSLYWQSSEVNRNVKQLQMRSVLASKVAVELPFLPEDLENLRVKAESLNLWQLQEQIAFLQENGGDTTELSMAFWKKIASPLGVLAMIAIVFPLIFGSQRQVSMGQRIFIGVLIGLLFHLGNQLVGNLSVVYQFPVVIAAFLPAGILLIIALFWLRWQR